MLSEQQAPGYRIGMVVAMLTLVLAIGAMAYDGYVRHRTLANMESQMQSLQKRSRELNAYAEASAARLQELTRRVQELKERAAKPPN